MRRLLMSACVFLMTNWATFADDNADSNKAKFTHHTGHFEKNNSGLKGDVSVLLIHNNVEFEKVFGTVPPLRGSNNNPIPNDAFKDHVIFAVITRAAAITEYSDISVAEKDSVWTVKFQSVTGAPGTANFASPLILRVPAGKITRVIFEANGKQIGEIKE